MWADVPHSRTDGATAESWILPPTRCGFADHHLDDKESQHKVPGTEAGDPQEPVHSSREILAISDDGMRGAREEVGSIDDG